MGSMTHAHPYDSITREQIEQYGSLKWTAYPGAAGAWIAEMDFGVAPAIREAYLSVDARDLYGYAPAELVADMQQATADFYRDSYGWNVDPAMIAPLPDVLAGLSAAINLFTPPGSKVVVPTPAYMPFLDLPTVAGREIVEVPLIRRLGAAQGEGSWEFDYQALDAALAAAGPDGTSGGLLIMCNPHNPIGKVYTREELARIAEIVDRHGAVVFNDEIHAPLVYAGNEHINYPTVSAAAAQHTVTATSHSKSFNTPGLKCAQLIFSNPAHLRIWEQKGTFLSKGASNPGLLCAVAAYRDSRDWLADTRDYLSGNIDALGELLAEHLPQVGYIRPQGTYLAFLDMSALGLPGSPQQFFLDNAHIALTDGRLCGVIGENHARLNLGTPRPILTQIIRDMAQAVRAAADMHTEQGA